VTARKLNYYSDIILGFPEEISPGIFSIEIDEEPYDEEIGSCIHPASYITACARINLMNGVKKLSNNFTLDNIYYMDTDSIITSGKMV